MGVKETGTTGSRAAKRKSHSKASSSSSKKAKINSEQSACRIDENLHSASSHTMLDNLQFNINTISDNLQNDSMLMDSTNIAAAAVQLAAQATALFPHLSPDDWAQALFPHISTQIALQHPPNFTNNIFPIPQTQLPSFPLTPVPPLIPQPQEEPITRPLSSFKEDLPEPDSSEAEVEENETEEDEYQDDFQEPEASSADSEDEYSSASEFAPDSPKPVSAKMKAGKPQSSKAKNTSSGPAFKTNAHYHSMKNFFTPAGRPKKEELPDMCCNLFEQTNKSRYKPAHLGVLQKVFEVTFFPTKSVREYLANQIDGDTRGLQVWFQNRRQKWKKNYTKQINEKKARGLISKNESNKDLIKDATKTGDLSISQISAWFKASTGIASVRKPIVESEEEEEEQEKREEEQEVIIAVEKQPAQQDLNVGRDAWWAKERDDCDGEAEKETIGEQQTEAPVMNEEVIRAIAAAADHMMSFGSSSSSLAAMADANLNPVDLARLIHDEQIKRIQSFYEEKK